MDYILDVLLQKSEISKINLSEVLVEWGGEKFSQDPHRYTNKSKLFFIEYEDSEYYKRFLGDQYLKDRFVALHLEGSLLGLEISINGKGDFLNNEIMLFLTELLDLEEFVILIIRDEEWIDEKYVISKKEELQSIVYNSLSWSNPKGVIITNDERNVREVGRYAE